MLTVDADGELIKIPLTFNRSDLEIIGAAETPKAKMDAFFAKYLGDIYDEIGDDDIKALTEAWGDARRELGMPDMGESSASPNS